MRSDIDKPDFIDSILEKTVLPSFSSMGPAIRRRRHDWVPLGSLNLTGKVVVLTGGTSGIGSAAASIYAASKATLVLLARNAEKATQQIDQLRRDSGNPNIHAVMADLGDQDQLRRAAEVIAESYPVIDVLVHNAGALFNERQRAPNGTDLGVELMVAAPFLLTGLLLPQLGYSSSGSTAALRHGPGRVITMSSGGMYTQGLHVDTLQMPDSEYSGVRQYARAKRAQVILNEVWAERVCKKEVVFHALHPGWVDTPGINDALPGFVRLLRPLRLLRQPREGADTLVWLSAARQPAYSSGVFWHDRCPRAIDMSRRTREADTSEKRDALWAWCEAHTGWHLSAPNDRPLHVTGSPRKSAT